MKLFVARFVLFLYALSSISIAQTSGDAHIKRVEHGLLPPVLIEGEPGWSITERMKFYKVPALSIAVIKDFKIDWARAYGVKDLETKEPGCH